MGYAQGMVSGVSAQLGINRDRRDAETSQLRSAAPQVSGMVPGAVVRQAVPVRGMAPPAPELGLARQQVQSRYDEEIERERLERIAKGEAEDAADWNAAAQGIIGKDFRRAEYFLAKHGNPDLRGKIVKQADGTLALIPQKRDGENFIEFGGQREDLPEQEGPLTIPFANEKELFNFFTTYKPKGASLEPLKPADRKFKAAGDAKTGFRLFDENSGQGPEGLFIQPARDDGRGDKDGAKGGKLDNDAYKLFDDQLNKQFLAEFQATLPAEQKEMADLMESDAFGNQRVSMERVVAKMPKEMRERYNAARQVGENFMADGSLAPILAANKAYGYASQPKSADQPQWPTSEFAAVDPKNPAAVQEVSTYLATLPVEEYAAAVKEMERDGLVDLARALQAQRGGKNTATAAAPRTRGMAPGKAASPADVLGQMRANIPVDNAVTRANEYPAKVLLAGLNQLANYFVADPVRAAASDIAKPFKAFQAWARAGGFNQPDPSALQQYAQVDPQGAQQIQQAAAQLASR